jgi:hypothetical protein
MVSILYRITIIDKGLVSGDDGENDLDTDRCEAKFPI